MGKTLKNYADWAIAEAMVDYSFYTRMYKRMLLVLFNWLGLPLSIDARYMERILYEEGRCAIYREKGGFLAVSKVYDVDAKNDYDKPTVIRVGKGRFRRRVTSKDFVIVKNDMLGYSSQLAVQHFAKRLDGIDRTINVNLEQLKQPSIVVCPEGQLLTAQHLWAQKESGVPVIFTSDNAFDNIDVKTFDLHVSNHINDLYDTKHEVVNESMTYFGVNNVNVIKRERLVTGEASQNDEQISLNLNTMYQSRLDAAREMSEKFGIDVKVEVNKYAPASAGMPTANSNKEDNANE